jgi:hypothetical protein
MDLESKFMGIKLLISINISKKIFLVINLYLLLKVMFYLSKIVKKYINSILNPKYILKINPTSKNLLNYKKIYSYLHTTLISNLTKIIIKDPSHNLNFNFHNKIENTKK